MPSYITLQYIFVLDQDRAARVCSTQLEFTHMSFLFHRYANRAKNIINKPTVNEDPNVKLIRELRAEIERLRHSIGDTSNDDTNDLKTLKALADKEAQEAHLTEEWTEKWKEAAKILDDHKALALKQTGKLEKLELTYMYLLLFYSIHRIFIF